MDEEYKGYIIRVNTDQTISVLNRDGEIIVNTENEDEARKYIDSLTSNNGKYVIVDQMGNPLDYNLRPVINKDNIEFYNSTRDAANRIYTKTKRDSIYPYIIIKYEHKEE